MLRAAYTRYILQFKTPSGTSRGILHDKETWFIKIWDDTNPHCYGVGECALFRGLSADDVPTYESKLYDVCRQIDNLQIDSLKSWSSIRFGVETALADLRNGGHHVIVDSSFVRGEKPIEINGLIWMGNKIAMRQQIEDKLNHGFRCIKLKIGAIDFESELSLLKEIRSRFSQSVIELRVDANGAFSTEEALFKLDALSRFGLHSIEQPIRQGQWETMSKLCRNTPIPIALDEELIGINDVSRKIEMLELIAPQYIILKPALAGGFSGSEEWISVAQKKNIGWWITSALESNIGLNAIAQWTSALNPVIPQGLGTGQLYKNNIESPLVRQSSVLTYDRKAKWDLSNLSWRYD